MLLPLKALSVLSVAALGLLGSACGPKLIPGLEVDLADTPDHRALIQVLATFQQSYEQKDVDALLALASKKFFETGGSAQTGDDYSYDGLRTKFAEHFQKIDQPALEIHLKGMTVTGDTATIDYRYVTRYLMKLPSGDKWQLTDEVARMKLAREGDKWLVLSGM